MDITRRQIVTRFPEDVRVSIRRVSIRKVDFTDLARDYAYEVNVYRDGEKLPSMFHGTQDRLQWIDAVEALREIRRHTYKGKRLI